MQVKVGYGLSQEMFPTELSIITMLENSQVTICYSMGVNKGSTVLIAPFTKETAKLPIFLLDALHTISKLLPTFLLEFVFKLFKRVTTESTSEI